MDWEDAPSVATALNATNLEQSEQDAIDAAIAAGGVELSGGYAERTSNYTRTGAGTDDVTGLTITVSADGTTPIILEVNAASINNSSASGIGGIAIQESSTVLTGITVSLTIDLAPVARKVRITPSAGSHTYKVTLGQIITGNTVLTAAAGSPAFLRATRAD